MIELLEASYLAMEGENILEEAKAFSTGILQERVSGLDGQLLKRAVHALELPMHWRVQWFDIKWQIDLYEQQEGKQSNLLQLARLNFNTVQATHQRDLRDISRWDLEQIQQLPECMKVCFRALRDVTYEIAREIGKDEDWHRVLPHLTKAWADFCKALLNEAKWENMGYTPSLKEYLSNAWTSSSGPLILSHAYYFMGLMKLEDAADLLKRNKDLIYNVSIVIRLCNDLGTSTAERERGDAPSSVVCYMREANVSEDIAQKHIKILINQAWNSINAHCFGNAEKPFLRPFINVTVNAARVVHMLYQFGDGFAIPEGDIQRQILSIVIKPLALD